MIASWLIKQQLKIEPSTRQAYLPIWFPEDTGAVHGRRVPCTLGYHFLIRNGKLQITYYIRSCDFLRHFRDDVYMAGRLAQWMTFRYNEDCPAAERIRVDKLVMHIVNFHVFEGDVPKLKLEKQRLDLLNASKLGALF
ncbi:MAG: thymidylate synthase [Actinobacteria bacterium]|nr:thymidylate synthase [Actinomycetota bacterium]